MPLRAGRGRRGRSGRTVRAAVAGTLFLIASLAGGGCTDTAKARGAATGALKDFRTSLVTFDGRVQASVRAIDRLQSSSTYDMPAAYRQFLTEMFNVSADANEMNQRAEKMREAGADYYIEARKQVAKKDDVAVAEELQRRQLATRAEYDVLQQRLGELREAYRIYLLQLEGVRRALENDQTREGVGRLGTELVEAREQAGRVRRAIGAAEKQTDAVANAAAAPKK
jgi:hypothetical protein